MHVDPFEYPVHVTHGGTADETDTSDFAFRQDALNERYDILEVEVIVLRSQQKNSILGGGYVISVQ
jgi:hypothetical protein